MFAGKLAVPKCWLFVAFNPLSFERSGLFCCFETTSKLQI